MSALAFWTWAAIAVLVAGSTAVFAWFLADALRGRARGRQTGAGRPSGGGPGARLPHDGDSGADPS